MPAYLFCGPSGYGTRAAARAFAADVLSAGTDGAARDRHRRLALAEEHPDLVVVERVGPSITADQARGVVRQSSLSPVEAEHKVLVLVDFHLVLDRAPIVLKAIEEPPPSSVFIVLADEVVPELVTIASRCVRIDFGPVPPAAIVRRAERRGRRYRRSIDSGRRCGRRSGASQAPCNGFAVG